MQNHIHIAIPLLDELENLDLLFQNLASQTLRDFSVYLCVNQPDEWWNDKIKKAICVRNQQSIEFIIAAKKTYSFPIFVINKSSIGQGWSNKKQGVGWARKTLMDEISINANPTDIIISLDADTQFSPTYFERIEGYFSKNQQIDCLSNPYYHPLNKSEQANRAILRYEIYMRYYLLNLFRINSPYAFSALGSAIAFRISAMHRIGGFTPKKSGEDFYFLQKMVKYRGIGIWNKEKVFPAARFSDRVFFGTGPAMIKGNSGDWSSYPIYPMELFDKIHEFYQLIPELFKGNINTQIDQFVGNMNFRNELWEKLRSNNKDLAHFSKAVHDYFDGLRILQFLKQNHQNDIDEVSLINFLRSDYGKGISENIIEKINFKSNTIEELNAIRDYLCSLEDQKREQQQFVTWKIS